LAGVKGRKTDLVLSTKLLETIFATLSPSKRRALDALERKGLIAVRHRPYKNPVVSILEPPQGA
jgi:hypothetical protein